MKQRDSEQLHTPGVSEPTDFALEDILREFGTKAAQPGETIVFAPIQDDAAKNENKARKAAIKDEQVTVYARKEKPAAIEKKAEQRRIVADTPAPVAKAPKQKPVIQPPSDAQRAARAAEKKSREKPHIQPVPQAQSIDLPTLLAQYRGKRMNSALRRIALGVLALGNLLLLCASGFSLSLLSSLSPNTLLLISTGLFLLSLLLAWEVPAQGIAGLIKLRPSAYSLFTVLAALCLVDVFRNARTDGFLYCAVANLALPFFFRALVLERTAMRTALSCLHRFESPVGVSEVTKILPNEKTLRRDKADTQEFLSRLLSPALPARVMGVYTAVALPSTLILAIFFSMRMNVAFIRGWLMLLLGAMPFAGMLAFSQPFAALTKRLAGIGGVLSGWSSARIFGKRHTILLRDEDVFPRANVTGNGMKIYGAQPATKVISYGLAALEAAQSPLASVFAAFLESQHGRHTRADSFRYYDNGGIGAQVGSDVVLIGSLSFMRVMGVYMPAGTKLRQAAYVSINGELCGVFALKYTPSASTRFGLRALLGNSNFSVILATQDFIISPDLIAAKYEVQTGSLLFPAFAERVRLSSSEAGEAARQGALIAKDNFGAFAATVAAGRTLRSSAMLSLALALFCGILGFILCTLLLAWNAMPTASPFHIACYHLLWALMTSFLSFIQLHF
ncbi:MAG: hypothetical protein LBM28_06380 [Oscillospiraceae bacterium]|jgi:hypothetical protein|nr:hypothetical protein [Oscillospiraceae bacterium]